MSHESSRRPLELEEVFAVMLYLEQKIVPEAVAYTFNRYFISFSGRNSDKHDVAYRGVDGYMYSLFSLEDVATWCNKKG